MIQPAAPRPRPCLKRRIHLRKRWLLLAMPFVVFGGLIALAPVAPERSDLEDRAVRSAQQRGRDAKPFRYIPDDEVYALDLDPRRVRFGLLEGWDREQDAYQDSAALAYVSGPMYERHVDDDGREITVPLGDLKFGNQVWRGRNRSASRQRAFVGIRHNGSIDFGYGELTDERSRIYDTFIGGLHSLYNDIEAPPESYKGAYSISMGQRIRYYLPRIRMVMGLRQDGYMEVLMSRDGLTLEQTKDLARRRGYLAAYMPDHASKSRLIIPGVKGFTEEDANWISGGATSFVHVPYMLRLSPRQIPLQGNLIDDLIPRLVLDEGCDGPIDCVSSLSNHLADRALAGLNRLMEQGVEPLARMIWGPTNLTKPGSPEDADDPRIDLNRAPLREPPITADPLVLREQPAVIRQLEPVESDSDDSSDDSSDTSWTEPQPFVPLPPDLPPPIVLDQPMLNPAEVLVDEPAPPLTSLPDLPPLPPVSLPVDRN